MKHGNFIVFIMLLLVGISSCGITHKVVSRTHEISMTNDTTTNDINQLHSLFIDTTNTLNLKIEYKKIEFYKNTASYKSQIKPDTARQIKSITTYLISNNSTKKGVKNDVTSLASLNNKITHEIKESTVKSTNIHRPNIFAQLKWILLFVCIIFIIYIAFKLMRKFKII